MTQFQSALILAGVCVVLLVYLYNWWQQVRRRREIERAVAAHMGRERSEGPDPLAPDTSPEPAPAPRARLREPFSRTEPRIGGDVVDPGDAATGFETDDDAVSRPRGGQQFRVPVADEPDEPQESAHDAASADDTPPDHGGHAHLDAGSDALDQDSWPDRAEFDHAEPEHVDADDATSAVTAPPESRPAEPAPARSRANQPRATGLPLRPDPPSVDTRVDYLVRMLPLEPVSAETLSEILASAPDVGRQMVVLGCPVGSQEWQPLLRQSVRYEELAIALQQVDRGGLITRAALDRFADWVDDVAERITATCIPPDPEEAHATAAVFDTFCAEADVLIGINVVAPDVPIPATKIRALAEAAGFRLQLLGHFALENDDGMVLLTLADIEGRPFISERIRTAASTGVTLLLDIPRTPAPGRVFSQMMQVARQVAQGIGGRVVDDKRQNLGDAGVRLIAERIAALEEQLSAQQMPPGSALARRVFA